MDVSDQFPDRPLEPVTHIGREAVDENDVCEFGEEGEIKNVYTVFDAKAGTGEERGRKAVDDVELRHEGLGWRLDIEGLGVEGWRERRTPR